MGTDKRNGSKNASRSGGPMRPKGQPGQKPPRQEPPKRSGSSTAKRAKGAGLQKGRPKPSPNPKAKPKVKGKAKPKTKPPVRRKNKSVDLEAYRRKRALAKQRVASISGAIALAMIFLAVGAYLLRGAFTMVKKPQVATVVVELGSIDGPGELPGVIIRDETVYQSPAEGTLYFNFSDMDKLKPGAQVCAIQNDVAVQEISTELAGVETEILDLQSRRENYSGFSEDVKRTNKQIQDMVDAGVLHLMGGSFQGLYALKEDVNRSLDVRNNMMMTENRGSVKDMVAQKQSYEKLLGENVAVISANKGGVLSYTVDGQESVYTFENMHTLTETQTKVKADADRIERKKVVAAGDPIFKVVTTNEWYIAAYVPQNQSMAWQEGDSRLLYVAKDNAYMPVETMINTITPGEKTNFVLFKCSKYMMDFLNQRSVSFKLSESGEQGLKVPVITVADKTLLKIPNAFVYDNGKKMVIRKGPQVDETLEIKPKDADDMYTYVFLDDASVLKLGDVLVNNDDKTKTVALNEVENVKGLFVLNNGYADFKKVRITPETPKNNDYIILDPETNKQIRVNDRIVYDTKSVVDGQKLE